MVNPRAVRRFAEAMGALEKTGRIAAGRIAAFAAARGVAPTPLPNAAHLKLRALVTRLQQLVAVQTAQRNQRRLVTEPAVLEGFTALLALVAKQIRALEEEIAALIAQDPLWQQLDAAFRSIRGVADRTVARLAAELPEIGTLDGKAIAKLVGLAPMARDSGKSRGHRGVRGGRAGVRSILFVIAELVRRHEPDFTRFHQRLAEAGKPKKVIRVALAHKLLVRLNAKARDVRAAWPAAAAPTPS